jgi:hypothetical protein
VEVAEEAGPGLFTLPAPACSAIRSWPWRPVSTTGPGGSWTLDPANRSSVNRPPAEVLALKVNLDLVLVAGLMDFLAGHRAEAELPLRGSGSLRGRRASQWPRHEALEVNCGGR